MIVKPESGRRAFLAVMDQRRAPALDRTFVLRSAFWFALAVGLFLVWQLAEVFVSAFGAVVVAVLLRSLSEPIRDHTPLTDGVSVVAAILLILGVASGAGWLFRHTLAAQLSGLSALLPHSLAQLRAQVGQLPFGEFILDHVAGSAPSALHGVVGRIGGYAITAAGALVDAVIVVFIGVFLAFEPGRARNGLLMLLPRGPREAIGEAMDVSGRALRLWLGGMLIEMLVIGVLTGTGAWLLGLPTPIALGVIGGLSEIVPYVGPVLSAIPALLLALDQSWTTVAWTLVTYLGIHQVEGDLIYPFIQKRAAKLPPSLTLLMVLAATVLFGPIGVVLATPLLVVLLTFVKLLYIRRTLGEDVEVAGERS